MPRRVLIVSYTFPPVGGAGVQRVTKFVKYLPQFGWEPTVLTCANPSVPAVDESLARDVPEGTRVIRARTLEPAYSIKAALVADRPQKSRFAQAVKGAVKRAALRCAKAALQPDPQILWMPAAIAEGRRLLREGGYSAIFASGPPFSALMIAARLSRRSGTPLVLDYRDEWDLSNSCWENRKVGPLSTRVQRRQQIAALRSAAAVVATTQASAAALAVLHRRARGESRTECIYNGYDDDDLAVSGEARKSDALRVAYVGTLWNLASIRPLVAAIHLVGNDVESAARGIELVVAGRRTDAEQASIDSLREAQVRVEQHAYLPHSEAVDLMASADVLCVLLSDLPGAERVLPAKVFEYIALGKPILAIAPRGELWTVFRDYPLARVFEPADVTGIARCLVGWSESLPAPQLRRIQPPPQFSRLNLTRQLAALLDSVCSDGTTHVHAEMDVERSTNDSPSSCATTG